MAGDVVAVLDEELDGEPLLVPAMRGGERVVDEPLEAIRERSRAQLAALPRRFRRFPSPAEVEPYPVELSGELAALPRA
jgi:hypothetical protein